MQIDKILTELREEQKRYDEAIVVLERLAAGTGQKRRGRPPAWMSKLKKGPELVAGARRSKRAA